MTGPETVLVLGAGASAPYGFPLGRGLRDDVCRLCRSPTRALCDISGFSEGDFTAFGGRLGESGYTSVDWYLEVNPEDMNIGRVAIAACLTGYEKPETLFPGPQDHWYEVVANWWWSDKNDLSGGSHVSVLTFNYDRSLEHYLSTVAARRVRSEPEEVMESVDGDVDEVIIARGPRLLHLHGQLNGPYSNTWSPERLETNSLRLLSSIEDDSAEFARARELIRKAQCIYFLGFGFNDRSVRRLGDFSDLFFAKKAHISGTHNGFRANAWDRIRDSLFPNCWKELQGWGSVQDFVDYNRF